jgi:branched-chain amino acid transport system permease protein
VTFHPIVCLTGLAHASSLFLVASGLTIIFGVTRIVNFAHGAFYMLGAYLAYSLSQLWMEMAGAGAGFWGAVVAAAFGVALVGVLMEVVLLRRIYRAPELFQLLATFGVVLLLEDATLWLWGPEDLLGPRAPGLRGAVLIGGQRFPEYQLFLLCLGPVVLGALWLLFHRTRWGTLVRAVALDREMVGALGVNQRRLFSSVFFLGSFLTGLGGALQVPLGAITLQMHWNVIAESFVVLVIGGMGSFVGAFLAALLLGQLSAFGALVFPELTLVLTFVAMALVLAVRPYGLLGRAEQVAYRRSVHAEASFGEPSPALPWLAAGVLLVLSAVVALAGDYLGLLVTEGAIFALLAASLQFITGIGGLISFGHAAYFGLGAYTAALIFSRSLGGLPLALLVAPVTAGVVALVFGAISLRRTGIYLSMLTLAGAQIVWAVAYQSTWTGGDNGILGVWPSGVFAQKATYSFLALASVAVCLGFLRRAALAPFGYALRAARDSPLRAESIGIAVRGQQLAAFTLAAAFAGFSGALYALHKGSVFPDVLSISRSVDALVMVLLGGIQTLVGPIVGAAAYHYLQTEAMAATEYWRAVLGAIILLLVVLLPEGIVGFVRRHAARFRTAGVSKLKASTEGLEAEPPH